MGDSELQKKGKIKDKIKKISIRVPGDPNGIYKHWKRKTKSLLKKTKSSPHLQIFNEEEEEVMNHNVLYGKTKQILNIDESSKLSTMSTMKTKYMNHKNNDDQIHKLQRDRLNSYPPNNMMYSLKSPHLSSPSSSQSNTSLSN